MFGRKKKEFGQKSQNGAIKRIRVIPDEFYGGKDPVIYSPHTATKSSATKDVRAQDIKKTVQVGQVSRFAGRKFMIIAAGGVFLIGVIGGSVYYLRPTSNPVPENGLPAVVDIVPPTAEVPTTTPIVEVAEVVPTSTLVVSISQPGRLEFPNLQITDAADMDSDALTDFEEDSFGTDPGKWDTDSDGYYDGQELVNLYNPLGFAPVKLIDSGLVAEYVNPVLQYRLYYPINWQIGEVDSAANQVLFSTISGDFIEVAVFEKNSTDTFADWFARSAAGQQFTDVVPFTNRFQESGYRRKDGLVAYFMNTNRVYVFIYHPGSANIVSYRHIVQMMYSSFRPGRTIVEIPDQKILPGVINPEIKIVSTTMFESAVNSTTLEITTSSSVLLENTSGGSASESAGSIGGVG
ncbi:MAG TPA: hypothetical protein PLV72_02925 [Candidatus Magasanikbacteria bacterium]|nr:hypothetical protein [Candidatus Magasanikbacteria bacterium]